MKIYTMGFTKKNAEVFFSKLLRPGIKRVVDVRLYNNSQLAGFTKRDDLRFFLHEIVGIDYHHIPELSPTKELFDGFKKRKTIDWSTYERQFNELLIQRNIAGIIPQAQINGSCLLCSESKPEHCHRRLVAEYFQDCWGEIEIEHL